MTGRTTVLAACGGKKRRLAQGVACPIGDLYTSGYFALKRELGELADEWYVLSAKHGLIDPTEPVEYYDRHLDDLSITERSRWAAQVVKDLRKVVEPDDTIVILGGRSYVEPIGDRVPPSMLDQFYDPFFNTAGIGGQNGWMRRAIDAGEPLLPVDETAGDDGDKEADGDEPDGINDRLSHPCEECGREVPVASERCADCLSGDREPTLADFAGGGPA